ncbi:unnamed protein product [Closterium sp. NIES-54]
MEVVRTSTIHASVPHFMWPSAVRYAAHQLKFWPRVSFAKTSPTLRWTEKVDDASAFRIWGALSLVRDTTASKLSPCTLRCVFLDFPIDAPPWQLYYPRTRRVLSSQDVTFDESVCFYRLHPHASHPVPLTPLFLVPVPPPVDPFPPQGPAALGVSQVDPPLLVELLEIFYDSSSPAEGGDPAADDTAATRRSPRLETPPGFLPRPSSPPLQLVAVDTGAAGGGDTGGEGCGGPGVGQQQLPSRLETPSPQQLREWVVRRGRSGAGALSFLDAGAAPAGGSAEGAGGAGGTTGTGGAGARGTGGPGGAGAPGRGGARTRGAGAAEAGGAGGAGGVGAGGSGGMVLEVLELPELQVVTGASSYTVLALVAAILFTKKPCSMHHELMLLCYCIFWSGTGIFSLVIPPHFCLRIELLSSCWLALLLTSQPLVYLSCQA